MTRIKHSSYPGAAGLELSIENLLAEHYSYILHLAISILDDLHEAEDAAQETFIAADRALSSFRTESNPKTWLTAIVLNTCRGHLRKRKIRQAMTSTLQSLHLVKPAAPSPEQVAIQNEVDHKVWRAIDDLDDRHRMVVILHYVHELNVPEISRILHLNQGTIHSRLHYARLKLHDKLGHLDPQLEARDGSIH